MPEVIVWHNLVDFMELFSPLNSLHDSTAVKPVGIITMRLYFVLLSCITLLCVSCSDDVPTAPAQPTILTITSFTPDSGTIGTSVLISGINFHPNPDSNFVYFGLHRATVDSASTSAIRVHVPDSAATGFIIVRTSAGVDTSDKPFRIVTTFQQPVPFISVITPDSGTIGTSVLISGINFHPNPDSNFVYFGLHRATVDSASTSAIRIHVPDSAATGFIIVRTSAGVDTSEKTFRVITPHAAISDFSPKYGQPYTQFTIYGSNLDKVTDLFVGSGRASITLRLPDSIQAHLPLDFTRSARLTAIAGNDTIRTSDSIFIEPLFRYPALNITKGLPGSEVILNVKNFTDYYSTARVFFGDYEAMILSRSETTLKVVVPDEAKTAPIRIQTRVVSLSTTYTFIVLQPPPAVISSFFPESNNFSDTLTIYGSNFGTKLNGWQVRIGTTVAQITMMTSTMINIVIPTTLPLGFYDVFVDYRGQIAKAPKQFEIVAKSALKYVSGNVSFNIPERITWIHQWKDSGQGFFKIDTTSHTVTFSVPLLNCPPPSFIYFQCRRGIHNDTIEFCCPLSNGNSNGEYAMIIIDTLNKMLKQVYINHQKESSSSTGDGVNIVNNSISLRLKDIPYTITNDGRLIATVSEKNFSNSISHFAYKNVNKWMPSWGSNWNQTTETTLNLLPFSTGNSFRLELRR